MKTKISVFFLALASVVLCFSSCKDDGPESNPNNILAENMISVLDVTDIQVVLDNKAKTIDISIPFDFKDSMNKLTIAFNDLPTGAVVSPEGVEKDFSNNLRQNFTVTFKDGEVKVYSVGVTYGAFQPKFVWLKLNGVTATFEAGVYTTQLLGSEDLKKVKISYEANDPNVIVKIKNTDNDTYVVLDSAVATHNFEDKANGRKIQLEFNGVTVVVIAKVRTSGYSSLIKVWQTYANFGTPDFYGVTPLAGATAGTVVPASPGNDAWDRGLAMDDNYIYMARSNKHMSAESATPPFYPAYGIIAIKISDKSATLLSREGMYSVGETGLGAHGTTDVNVIGGKIVACNLANAANNNLKIFVWDDVNALPKIVLTYNVGAAPSPRLGDKFTFEGNWTNGVIRFVDYVKGAGRYYEFKISGGNANPTIDPVPTIVNIPDINKDNNTIGGVYKFSNTEFLFSGTGNQAAVFNPITKVKTYTTSSSVFPASEVGDALITFNDKQYLAYVFQKNTGMGWALRLRPLDYPTLAESLEKISPKSLDINLSGLLADDLSLVANGNSTGKVYVHTTTTGVTYVLALASNQGFGLFRLE